ncbi:hypothetical protein Pmani_014534 [Petrolisthes manimaculis]|uniref:Uncharacterized protein n=1 Tax=Petrolisthes manimaculis TaxID=1843537 RepID=A0AAE1U8A3_9EUCA|nr:hypothetical protein Pmani_014534 [Petrolisthes manimaculis]
MTAPGPVKEKTEHPHPKKENRSKASVREVGNRWRNNDTAAVPFVPPPPPPRILLSQPFRPIPSSGPNYPTALNTT